MNSKNKLRGLAFASALLLMLFSGCKADLISGSGESALTPVISAKTVTDLSATTDGKDSVTITFDGQTDAEDCNLSYEVRYRLSPDFSTVYTTAIVPSDGQTTFSVKIPALEPGTHVLAAVVTKITYRQGTKDAVFSSMESETAEGAVLPVFQLSSLVEGSKVTLVWDDDPLYSAIDSERKLYDGFVFKLRRTLNGIESIVYTGTGSQFSQTLSGNAVNASYALSIDLGNGIEIESESIDITTASSSSPVAALSAAASQGTEKSSVKVQWVMPDYVTGLGEGVTVVHRAKVERSVSGQDSWETVVSQTDDINTDEYGWTPDGTLGKASYCFTDSSVDKNTLYDYRVTSYYLRNSKNLIRQSDSEEIIRTANPGYAIWLPSDLSVSSSNVGSAAVSISLSWNYADPSEGDGSFVLSRVDAYGTEVFESVTGFSYTDAFTMGTAGDETDSRYNHSYTYSLKLKYSDGTYSESISTSEPVVYSTAFESIRYMTDLSVSQGKAKKIVVSWNENLTGNSVELDPAFLHYSIQESLSKEDVAASAVVVSSLANPECFIKSGSTITVTFDGLEDGIKPYFRVVAAYSGDGDASHAAYNDTASIIVEQGSTLAIPSRLAASDGTSSSSVSIRFNPSEGASGYRLSYRLSGSEGAFAAQNLSESEMQFTPDGAAGLIYEFIVQAKDSSGELTDASQAETGCLFGPALMSPSATQNESSDSFRVSWTAACGADGYSLDVRRSSDDAFIGNAYVSAQEGQTSYELVFHSSDDMFAPSDANPYPLSEKYKVLVIPEKEGLDPVSESLITPAEGCWLAPPKGIQASKAASGQEIKVSWTAVDGADSYRLYTSSDGSSWSAGTSLTVTSYVLNSKNDTYFTLETVKGTLVSQKQVFRSGDDSNFGYVLKAPAVFNVTSSVSKPYFTLSWTSVADAEDYYITQGSSTAVKASVQGLGAGQSSGTAGTAGYMERSSDGKTFTLLYEGKTVADPASCKSSFSISSSRTADSVEFYSAQSSASDDAYRMLKPEEVLNIVNYFLSEELHKANDSFGGDWWPPSGATESVGQKEYAGKPGVSIKSSYASSWGSPTQKSGSLELSSAMIGESGFGLSTSASLEIKAKDQEGAGYLGTDPLLSIGTGTIEVTFPQSPYNRKTATVEITETLDVQAGTGKYRVTCDGASVDFEYSASAVKPY